MNNFFKKFIVLISFGFILFGFNFASAITEENVTCIAPQVINETGDGCINVAIETKPLECILPQILNETSDVCIDPVPEIIVCTEPQILIDGVCTDQAVELEPDYVKIHLEIISGADSLYDDDILVTACDNEGNGVLKATPYCALVQSKVLSDWSGLWINSIGGFSNDFTNNLFWMWLANLNIDNTNPGSSYNLSAKQYEVSPNDQILFYYNTNPLNISVDSLTPALNDVLTVAVKELGLDSSWNPIWAPSLLSKVVIGSNVFDVDENGEYKINILNTDSFTILGQKDGFIDSSLVAITPVVSNQGENNGGGNNSDNGGGGGSDVEENFSIENALSFLSLQQESDGSFGDSLYTDWVAIATSKVGGDANMLNSKLRNYLKNESFEASNITDYERHAMALMALGINPYDGTDINYIGEIVDSFDGKQIGYDSLYNDDIFALIVLSSAGYSKKDEMIEKIVSYVISKQSSSGAWGSIDMTAAAIEALSNFESLDGVEDAISKGESYLVGKQKSDGSFENVFSTSWAIQALSLNNAFNDEVDNAIKYLISNQQSDGGVTDDSNIKSRIWATSYALPAVSKLSWNNILESFSKEENEESNSSDDGEEKVSEEENKETVVLIDEAKLMDVSKKETKPVEPKVEIKAMQNVALGDTKGQQSDRENFDGNLLGASALDSGQINENSHFLSFISMVFDIIKTLFNRLLVVLHI